MKFFQILETRGLNFLNEMHGINSSYGGYCNLRYGRNKNLFRAEIPKQDPVQLGQLALIKNNDSYTHN
jgi:hypothetical protein